MTDPISFSSTTPRFALPLIYAAQAQKEAFVNEAHAIADAVLHCAVEGIIAAPPPEPQDGQNWIVGASPSGAFAGHAEKIACRQEGQWLFVSPGDGMRVYDSAAGQDRRFANGWVAAGDVTSPSGGNVEDTQARAAIDQIIAALRDAGITPAL